MTSLNGTVKKDSNEDYHANKEYIGSTSLKKYMKSPLYYKEAIQEDTPALIFGSAYHCFVLEPELFAKEYYVLDPEDRPDKTKTMAANDNKYWKADLVDTYQDKLISIDIFNVLKAMKARLFSHPYARYLLTGGENEVSHYTEYDGVKVKIRTDSIIEKKCIIADLKTCQDASKDKFPNNSAEFGYHFSGAFYTDVAQHIYNTFQTWKFYIIAQEKKAPYLFNIFRLSSQALAIGNYEYKQCLDQHVYCEQTGEYRGLDIFADNEFGINELNVPAYKVKEINFYNEY
jgi:hypothetical protein